MPKIEPIQPLGVPHVPLPGPDKFGYNAFGDVRQLGSSLEELGQKVWQNQDNTDIIKLKAGYDKDLEDLKLSVRQEPDPRKHEQMFAEGAAALQDKYKDMAPDQKVGRILGNTMTAEFGQHQKEVQYYAWERGIQNQRADADYIGDTLAPVIARTEDPQQRAIGMSHFEGLIDEGVKHGIFKPEEGEEKKRAFRDKVGIANMIVTASQQGFDKLWDQFNKGEYDYIRDQGKVQETLNTMQKLDNALRLRANSQFEQKSKAEGEEAFAQIGRGELSDDRLQAMATGKPDPAGAFTHILPKQAEELYQYSQKSLFGQDGSTLNAIRHEYELASPSLKSIEDAKNAIRQAGLKGKPVDDFLDHLNQRNLAIRSTGEEKMWKNIKHAQDWFDNEVGISVAGIIVKELGVRDQNARKQIHNRLAEAIQDGENWQEIAKEAAAQWKAGKKQGADPKQDKFNNADEEAK